jgi:hypothetical protein
LLPPSLPSDVPFPISPGLYKVLPLPLHKSQVICCQSGVPRAPTVAMAMNSFLSLSVTAVSCKDRK